MPATVKKGLKALLDKGVTELYHANSVVTSCEFLRQGALLSRGSVESMKLRQTPQFTDAVDKRYNIWNDVFVDSVDIHTRGSRANHYGPVLFVLDTEKLMNDLTTGQLSFTRYNPSKWAKITQHRRWFADMDEVAEEFDVNNFDHMVVFRHCGGHVPLKNSLKKIIVDTPVDVEGAGLDLYSYALGALKYAMHLGPKRCVIQRRNCDEDCGCHANYTDDLDRTLMMYRSFIKTS